MLRFYSSAWWAAAKVGWRRRTPPVPQVGHIAQALVPVDLEKGRQGYIIPGLFCELAPGAADVMRGEETLALGAGVGNGLICSAGTHPKWIEMKSGRIERFATYMTGEMYALLREHSMIEPAPNKGAVGARILTTTYGQASTNSPWLRPQIGPIAKWPLYAPACSSRPPEKLFCGKGRGRIGTIPGLFLPDPTETIEAAPCHPEDASSC